MIRSQESFHLENKKYASSTKEMGISLEEGIHMEVQENNTNQFKALIKSDRSSAIFQVDLTPEKRGPAALQKIK